MSVLIADIEANGLYDDVTEIHCIGIKRKGASSVQLYYDKNVTSEPKAGAISDAVELLAKAELVIGHNWIDYDCRVIKKFYPEFLINTNKIRDTFRS